MEKQRLFGISSRSNMLTIILMLCLFGIMLVLFTNRAGSAGSAVQFTIDDTAGIPTTLNRKSGGMAWGDFNRDGWLDLYVSNHFMQKPLFYVSNRDGTFTEQADMAGLSVHTDRHGVAWADYDRDGDLDMYVVAGGAGGSGSSDSPAQLWRNNGDGTFTDVAVAMGVETNSDERGRTVNWFDYDADSDLDMLVTNYSNLPQHPASRLFRNDGNVFTDVAVAAGIGNQLPTGCGAMSDYDGDSDLDILFGQDFREVGGLLLYSNQGDGTYVDVPAAVSGLNGSDLHHPIWFDYDNDGDNDIFAFSVQENGIIRLYRNDGGIFTDVTDSTGLAGVNPGPANHAIAFDADNDGFLDLFVVLGVEESGNTNVGDMLFHNNGDGTFTDITAEAGVAGSANGAGNAAAVADYNRDGFLDFIVGNGDAPYSGPYILYQNNGNDNHWLRIKLRGTVSNSHAIGSKIWLIESGKLQYREYLDFTSCLVQNEQIAHFGVGDATDIDRIIVQWPDGGVTIARNVQVDRVFTVTQPVP